MVVITPSMAENFRYNIQLFQNWYSALCVEFPFLDPLVRLAGLFIAFCFCVIVFHRILDASKE